MKAMGCGGGWALSLSYVIGWGGRACRKSSTTPILRLTEVTGVLNHTWWMLRDMIEYFNHSICYQKSNENPLSRIIEYFQINQINWNFFRSDFYNFHSFGETNQRKIYNKVRKIILPFPLDSDLFVHGFSLTYQLLFWLFLLWVEAEHHCCPTN